MCRFQGFLQFNEISLNSKCITEKSLQKGFLLRNQQRDKSVKNYLEETILSILWILKLARLEQLTIWSKETALTMKLFIRDLKVSSTYKPKIQNK